MIPVEGHKNLYRDEESNAIVSTDDSAYQDYMNTRRMNADKKAEMLTVEVLPKKLDEEVASLMVEGFGGTVTQLTKEQADYINVPQDGPFKEESYKY